MSGARGRRRRRPLTTALIVITTGYLVICGLLYFAQEKLLFFPTPLPQNHTYRFAEPFEEHSIAVEGATLSALLFRTPNPRGVIFYLHGNGGNLQDWGTLAPAFTAHAYDIFFLDYRGYGKSTGSISGEAQLHADVAAAYDYVKQRYPEEQIVLYGRSLGSGLVVALARTAQPRMLILETPYVSIRTLALRQYPFVPPFLLKYQMRSDLWIKDVRSPIALIHGTADELIPFESSATLATHIAGEHRMFAIEGGGHNNLSNYRQYHAALRELLE